MKIWTLIVAAIFCLSLSSCFERVVEPEDVFDAIGRGDTYSPASKMIDSWYGVEVIDAQTFAINEPKSSQYNTSYLIVGRDWVSLMSSELGKIVRGTPDYRYVAHYLAPGLPMRLQQNEDMYIYTTPFVDPHCSGRNGCCWWW